MIFHPLLASKNVANDVPLFVTVDNQNHTHHFNVSLTFFYQVNDEQKGMNDFIAILILSVWRSCFR